MKTSLSFNNIRCLALLLFAALLWAPGLLSGRDVVVIQHPEIPPAEKEAILILPGFGSKIHGSKAQKRYFSKTGYDVFIPDYISRKSIEKSVAYVDRFMQKHQLGAYKKVHVFAYIVGSWTINFWLQQHPDHHIASIVYDRSPLQERAPYALVKDSPFLIRLLAGPIMEEFSRTRYPVLPGAGIQIGIVVESKATKLIRRHKKTALGMGPVRWDLEALEQDHDDAMYTWLNHDDMYERFDIIGPEILHFFSTGKFTPQARRVPYTDDPFEKYQE
jgi:hypothetical protein